MVLTFFMCYELIQMLIDLNNLHYIDKWISFTWMSKTFVALLLLSNTFNIVMAVFDVFQNVINGGRDCREYIGKPRYSVRLVEIYPLHGLWMQSFLIRVVIVVISNIVFVIVYGKMIEIYLPASLVPVPMSTLVNLEIGGMSQNYLKSLFTVGFQGLLILVCVGIYAKLVQIIAVCGDPIGAI